MLYSKLPVMTSEKILLKDILFNKPKVVKIASEIASVYPSFKQESFIREVISKFPDLELKARIAWIAECLRSYLPSDYCYAVDILLQSLPEPNNPTLSDGDFGDFIYAPHAEFVAKNGCTKNDLDFSLKALREMTVRFSAEDAILYFINPFPEGTLHQLLNWCEDPHYHVRRLCSEGTRPRLPWSQKMMIPITSPLPILDKLFSDSTRFVTRSVANHVNDLSKIDPDLALELLIKWRKSGKQNSQEMDYIVRHSLRTLIKQGHPKAMQLLGFSHSARVTVSNFTVPKSVKINTALEFSFTVQAQENTDIIVDYILYFQNKLGKLNSKKVFKFKTMALKKGQPITLSKRHLLRQFMTTRTLYAGCHEIALQINGKTYARGSFELYAFSRVEKEVVS